MNITLEDLYMFVKEANKAMNDDNEVLTTIIMGESMFTIRVWLPDLDISSSETFLTHESKEVIMSRFTFLLDDVRSVQRSISVNL